MEPLPPLKDIARPFEAPKLPAGRPEADYVDAFLSVFGAARGKPVIYRDASGHVIPIGEDLFKRPDGSSKLRSYGRERGPDLARMAEAIADPDEIWISWGVGPDGKPRLVRRYLRSSPDSPEYASFGWTSTGWEGSTAFGPTKGASNKPDPDYLERQRNGALLWRRQKK